MRSENGADEKKRSFIEEARRAQIVSCAIDAIAEEGYVQTSLAKIAQRAGISKGVISYHFAGKEELIIQVAAQVVANGEAHVRPRVESAPDATSKLSAFIESNLEFLGANRNQLLALAQIAAYARYAVPDITGADIMLSAMERVIEMGQCAGQFREVNRRLVATSIRAAMDAVAELLISDPDLDLGQYARDLCDLFLAAIRKT
jgi:AcrR family transcriptional regulator